MIESLWFIAILVWLAILWLLVQSERGGLGFIVTIAYLIFIYFAFNVNVFSLVFANWLFAVIGIVFYGVVGGIWATFYWSLYSNEKTEPYFDMRDRWLSSKGISLSHKDPMLEELKEEWVRFIECDDDRISLCTTIKVKNNKSKIMTWIGYWPISLGSWVFQDMVRGAVKMIYNNIADRLQRIADRVFAKVRRDLPEDFKYAK